MAIDAALPRVVERLHAELAGESAGEVATYIPELSKANPDHFGIAVVTTGGDTVMAGDSEVEFTMQSVSKASRTACCSMRQGASRYLDRWCSPSSEPFSAIDSIRAPTAFNPILNAGAIAISARLREILGAGAFDHVLRVLGHAAGRDLRLDERVFQSELETGHRNRAIGHLLRNAGVFGIDVDAALDVYFRQCSVLVTARIAMMAPPGPIGTPPARAMFGSRGPRH